MFYNKFIKILKGDFMIYSIMERDKFIISDGCHTENILMVVLDGAFELFLRGNRFVVSKNSIVYFEKDIFFERKVIFPLKIIYVILDSTLNIDTGILNFKDTERITRTIKFLTYSVNNHNTHDVRHFCNDIITQYKIENKAIKVSYSSEILDFFEFVDNNHCHKIKIEEFSKSIFMSHTGFLLKFKKDVGITPSEYIANFRLEKSVDLLLNTSYSVGNIAEEVGYENLYYFSNAFKKRYNMSPQSFRKNNL